MATRHNLCTNPAVGVDVTGWGGGSTPTRVDATAEGLGRQWAARYTAEASTLMPPAQVTAGLTYTVSVYTYLSSGFPSNDGTAYIEWRDSGGGVISYSPAGYDIPGNAIGRIVVTATAPALAASARLTTGGLNFAFTPCDFTMLLMEQADAPGDYFDGDSDGGSWDGTPGLSASTLDDAPAVNEGTLTVALPALTAQAAGTVTVSGFAAVALPALTAHADGAVTVSGSVNVMLPALTAALRGANDVVGTLHAALPPLRVAMSGESDAQGGGGPGHLTVSSAPSSTLTPAHTSSALVPAVVDTASLTIAHTP